MKILFVLPARNRSGGVRVTIDMANLLLERGHRVRIAYRTKLSLKKRVRYILRYLLYRSMGVAKVNMDWIGRFMGEWVPFEDLNEIPISEDEVVIAIGLWTVSDVVNLRKRCIRCRYNHGLRPDLPEAMKNAYKFSMPTLAVARSLVPSLQALSGEKIIPVVPNGLYTEEYFVTGIHRDGIGSLYDLATQKGSYIVESLLQKTAQKWPDVPWYLYGSGKPPPNPPTGVHFKSYPSVEEVREIYNHCKIWLCPSRFEGFGLPILEAMASGCAVISTTNDGGLELIEPGVNGLLVPVDNTAAFVDAIDQLLHDEPLRQKFIENSQVTVTKFSWERAVKKMEGCMEDLIENGHFTHE